MLRYRENSQKILEALVLLAQKNPGKGFHNLLKILFYADKFHLQKYGRPVFGDVYIKMPYGPVGSFAYDILKKSDFIPQDILKTINESLEIRKENDIPAVFAKREPDLDCFSETDLECLNEAIDKCKKIDFASLTQITHEEKAWQQVNMNSEMNYELFIDEDIPDRDELIAYMKETAQTVLL